MTLNNQNSTISQEDPRLTEALEPGQLRVIKRNGSLAKFDDIRIEVAMKKAFLAVEGEHASNSERIQSITKTLTEQISQRFKRRWPYGGTIHIEAIQDQVELVLMRSGEQQIARAYVLYREKRRQERGETVARDSDIHVILDDGQRVPLDQHWLAQLAIDACADLKDVAPTQVIEDTRNNIFDGIALKDIYKAMVMSARTLVENEPNYTYVTARLLLQDLYNEALTGLSIAHDLTKQPIKTLYPKAFEGFLKHGVEHEHIDARLLEFDLQALSQAIKPERDQQFSYLSLQTLYDRYFIHHKGVRVELPQVFFMRVAMGLCLSEGAQKNERAIEFYNLMSSFDYMSSTPTLFNSGTLRPQLSSCFLTTVPDDLDGIYGAIKDNALLSKYAGGLGNDWTPVRGNWCLY